MRDSVTRVVLLLVPIAFAVIHVTAMDAMKIFQRGNCNTMPNTLIMKDSVDCEDSTCKPKEFGDSQYNASVKCNISDRFQYAAQVFTNYVVIEYYNSSSCERKSLYETDVYPASESCQLASTTGNQSVTVFIYPNGSLNVSFYKGDYCGGGSFSNIILSNAEVAKGDCDTDGRKVYTSYSLSASSGSSSSTSNSSDSSAVSQHGWSVSSASTTASFSGSGSEDTTTTDVSSGSSGVSVGAVAGIVVSVVVVVVMIGLLWYRCRSKKSKSDENDVDKGVDVYARVTSPTTRRKSTDSGITDFSGSLGVGPRSLAGLWDDEIIATARIPSEKVLLQQMISRGGYGEVYYGAFIGKRVAIKTLLPELRKSVKHVNDFLDEVRLLARLDHPRIVNFVGIAWDTLSDLCFVLEYMEGGDLRVLLASYEAQNHPTGFDHTKITIALHVAHALTYLHSLDPPVLHRDLKSKNILLSSELEAKVTDFGISRERVDKTMTAGVGTSLWMAPEVMMGERYDDKADVFSFGVVLSELDLHTLPYSHAKDNSNSGRKMPETAILQMVVLGKLRVEFSSGSLESMVTLANSCVAVDPKDRPTAAEVLHYLQTILRQEL